MIPIIITIITVITSTIAITPPTSTGTAESAWVTMKYSYNHYHDDAATSCSYISIPDTLRQIKVYRLEEMVTFQVVKFYCI